MKILWKFAAVTSTIFFAGTTGVNAAVFTLYNADGVNTPDTQTPQQSLKSGAICSAFDPFIGPCNTSGKLPFSVPVDQTVVVGGVRLNSFSNSAEYSGYGNYNPVTSNYVNTSIFNSSTLDRTTGYSLSFTVSLDSSTITSGSDGSTNPRAAFSVIAISSDKKGIEIGFRTNEIFAQSSNNFTSQDPLQTAVFSTNASKPYNLTVFNNGYTFSSGATPIINGVLIDYSSFVSDTPALPFNPYNTPSFVFFGDDTGKASGTFTLGKVTLDTTPVPFEFSPTYGLLAIGTGLAIRNWRKKAKDKIK